MGSSCSRAIDSQGTDQLRHCHSPARPIGSTLLDCRPQAVDYPVATAFCRDTQSVSYNTLVVSVEFGVPMAQQDTRHIFRNAHYRGDDFGTIFALSRSSGIFRKNLIILILAFVPRRPLRFARKGFIAGGAAKRTLNIGKRITLVEDRSRYEPNL